MSAQTRRGFFGRAFGGLLAAVGLGGLKPKRSFSDTLLWTPAKGDIVAILNNPERYLVMGVDPNIATLLPLPEWPYFNENVRLYAPPSSLRRISNLPLLPCDMGLGRSA